MARGAADAAYLNYLMCSFYLNMVKVRRRGKVKVTRKTKSRLRFTKLEFTNEDVKKHFDVRKTVKQNFESMGLVANPNTIRQGSQSALEVAPIGSKRERVVELFSACSVPAIGWAARVPDSPARQPSPTATTWAAPSAVRTL